MPHTLKLKPKPIHTFNRCKVVSKRIDKDNEKTLRDANTVERWRQKFSPRRRPRSRGSGTGKI